MGTIIKTTLIIILLGAATLILTQTLVRTEEEPHSPSQVNAYLEAAMSKAGPPGLSVAVIKENSVVYQEAFGWADRPSNLPTTIHTAYHWWSMTKIPTAVAIIQMHESRQINLDHPVSEYLPFFQVEYQGQPVTSITIRQLLSHTSGLADIMPAMIGWVHYQDEIYPQTQLLQQILPDHGRLKYPPGSKYSYSNLGYLVLGAVIEDVSGVSYEQYIQEMILTPLGMDCTGFLFSAEQEDIAVGSHPLFSVYTPLLPFLLDMDSLVREREGAQLWFNTVYIDITPSTGLIGPVDDAILFVQALLSGSDLLSPQGRQLLLSPGPEPPLGWPESNKSGRFWLQQSGGGPGYASIMRLYPEENLGIVVMANNTNLAREELVEVLAGVDWLITKEDPQ